MERGESISTSPVSRLSLWIDGVPRFDLLRRTTTLVGVDGTFGLGGVLGVSVSGLAKLDLIPADRLFFAGTDVCGDRKRRTICGLL